MFIKADHDAYQNEISDPGYECEGSDLVLALKNVLSDEDIADINLDSAEDYN